LDPNQAHHQSVGIIIEVDMSNRSIFESHKKTVGLIAGLLFGFGLLIIVLYLQTPSEAGVLLGLSLFRLFAGIGFLGLVLSAGIISYLSFSFHLRQETQYFNTFKAHFSDQQSLYKVLSGIFLISSTNIMVLVMVISPISLQIVTLEATFKHFGLFLIWVLATSLLMGLMVVLIYSKQLLKQGSESSLIIVFILDLILILFFIFVVLGQNKIIPRLSHSFELPIIGLSLYFSSWGFLNYQVVSDPSKRVFDQSIILIGIFMATFWLYHQLAAWVGWFGPSPGKSYWNLLAFRFLEGKLSLLNPFQTHDLTFYKGNWFVPNPPVPALIMLPLAYFSRSGDVNTIIFSISFCALNSVFLYLIIDELRLKGWSKISNSGNLWLMLLFTFGASQFYLGYIGRMWYVSQILTVTFIALATLLVLKSYPPWLVGISLGFAVGCRPNVLVLGPFLYFLFLQMKVDKKQQINLLGSFSWIIQFAIPVTIAIAGLFIYNYLRFENFLDFGYATINGAEEIVRNVQEYGMFNIHFLRNNLKIMFFSLPGLGKEWPISPKPEGMSLFIATPALIYLFHRYKLNLWIVGAWSGVFLSIVFLGLYHNTGSSQFGYRYLLDFIVPLWMLLATAFGHRTPRFFRVLVIVSVLVNVYGAVWFINTG
jgi:hypothetical protein